MGIAKVDGTAPGAPGEADFSAASGPLALL